MEKLLTKEINSYHRYLFVFGHPDDEQWVACIIGNLIANGKEVHLAYITSGDYFGKEVAVMREKEAASAAQFFNIPQERLYLLGYPENTLGRFITKAVKGIDSLIKKQGIECIVTHDHEGGNSVHDFTSFISYTCTRRNKIDMWAFPAYHNQGGQRVWNEFTAGRQPDFQLNLNHEQQKDKRKLFDLHVTQKIYFDKLLGSENGKKNVLGREILRFVDGPIDYTLPPTTQVGYDFPGSPVRFKDFIAYLRSANVDISD